MSSIEQLEAEVLNLPAVDRSRQADGGRGVSRNRICRRSRARLISTCTVTVATDYSWTDRYRHDEILEIATAPAVTA